MSHVSRAVAVLICLSFVPACIGQSNFGQINGTVSDPSGKALPAADVVLKSLDSEAMRRAVTSETGAFAILTVPPGRYSLTFRAPGFQTRVVPALRLQVNEARTVDAQLEIGGISERVEVQAAPVAVNQTDATLGTVIQQQEIVEIPLNGRNFAQLIQLSPGVIPIGLGQQVTFNITGGFSPSVNGMRPRSNNFTLDGIENNQRFANTFATPPPPDALEEFKVSSHQSDAASALTAGANVNLVTRAGTNALHGSVWEFLRNDKLAANGFFNNFFGSSNLPYRQNQYGFFVGGPVVIPRVINGRKAALYFSAYYEGTKFRRASTTTATVPSEAERQGNFSELLGAQIGTDCLGRPVRSGQIYDPGTTRKDAACPGGYVRDPFPNNVMPKIHPVAQAWLQYIYPTPNRSGVQNLVLPQRTVQDSDQWGIRTDHNFSDRNRTFGRVSQYEYQKTTPNPLPADLNVTTNRGMNVAGHHTFIYTPTLLFEFTGGYNRASIPYGDVPLGEDFRKAVGPNYAPDVPDGFLPATQQFLGSRFSFATYQFFELANPDDTIQGGVSVNKIHGNHRFNFGYNFIRLRHHTGRQGQVQLMYSAATTGLPGFTATGEGLASFFAGLPTSTSNGFSPPQSVFTNIQVAYAGDTWKVTPRLSLNLGLQWVYAAPPTGDQLSFFDLDKARSNPLATDFTFAYYWPTTNPITGAPPNISAGMFDPDRNNFAPRVGLSYSVAKDTVIRTGFGVFYDYGSNLVQNTSRGVKYPFATSQSVGGQNLLDIGPINLDNPFGSVSATAAAFTGTYDRHKRDPYSMQWNFGIERLLPGAILLDVDYVGSGSRKLVLPVLENTAPASPLPINPRRPWPNTSATGFLFTDAGNSSYNALQVKLERRFANGFTFRDSYSWSKAMDIDSDPPAGALEYPYDWRRSWGPATFHVPHVNSTAFVYQVPFGRGQRFGSSANHAVNAFLGGWQLSGIISIRSGQVYHVVSGRDSANTGHTLAATVERADIVSAPVPADFQQNRDHWFNPAAFAIPAFGTLGNESRDSQIGPALQNADIAMAKDFAITEPAKMEFRAEFFNIFNHTNFANPVATLASPLVGQIQGAYAARDIQLALKLRW